MRSGWIIAAWAAVTAGGFWWYDGRYRLPVAAPRAEQPALGKAFAEPKAKVTLLAFYSSDCACSHFALPHIRNLQRDYAAAGLKVMLVMEDGDEVPAGFQAISDHRRKIAKAFGVPAAPGAVVLDSSGHVVYTGGFNVARFCDDARTAFAQAAIVSTLAHKKVERARGEFYGCAMTVPG